MNLINFNNGFHGIRQWLSQPKLLGAIFCVFIVLNLAAYPKTIHAKSANESTLLVLGDSLSAAYGFDKQRGWVSLLKDKISPDGIQVINASASGQTVFEGVRHAKKLFSQHLPKWLILQLGANDALRGRSFNQIKQKLQNIIDVCFKNHCEVLLLGIRLPTNFGPAYDQALQTMYQEVAEKNNILFDPFFLEPVALVEELMQIDGLHPNAKAQPIIFKRLWPKIEQLITFIKTP